MFGVHYLHSNPTTYVMRYKNGQLVDFGLGLTLLYFGPTSTIVRINQASQDVPFVFEQTTLDYQDVTIQGSLTFRVASPERLAQQLDFSVDSRGRYVSDDPIKLQQRLVRLIQSKTNAFTRDQPLVEMLSASSHLANHLMREPALLNAASGLGLQIESILILSVRANPEMAEAMQADARERLLMRSDEAAHERRKATLELESEISRSQLDSEVALEEARAELVRQRAENEAKLAEVRMKAVRETLEAMRDVDWRTMVASGETDSKKLIAMVLSEFARTGDSGQ